MTQPDLFRADTTAWVDEQMRVLGLKPGDKDYDGARQAAESGWPAEAIRPLIWPKMRDAG
jgi:hypothetical protein